MAKLLPIVSQEIAGAVQEALEEKEGNAYISEILKRLSEGENPCIAQFIAGFSLTSKDPVSATYCGVLVYQLLRSQAEADELQRLILG